MKPTRSSQEELEELRRNGDARLSEAAEKILREITRGPDLARELAAMADRDPDIAG